MASRVKASGVTEAILCRVRELYLENELIDLQEYNYVLTKNGYSISL
jgi:hypothetical protein